MASSLSDVFATGSPALPEGFRTLVVSPERFVTPGMIVTARVSFTNLGGAPAVGVRVRFSSPPGLTFVTGSVALDECPAVAGLATGFDNPDIDIGAVAPGAVRRISIMYVVDPIIEDGTLIDVQAALVSEDMPLTGSNVARLTVQSRPELASASELCIRPVTTAAPHHDLLITAVVRNRGQSSANDVVVMLPMPAYTTFVAGSTRVDGRPVAATDAPQPFAVTDPSVVVPRLAPGEEVTVSHLATVDAPLGDGTIITATGAIASRDIREFELAPSSLRIQAPVQLDPDETRFEVLVEGHAVDAVVPGQRLTFVLVARNAGQSIARELSGSITLAPSLIFALGSLKLDGQPYPDGSRSPITCDFGDVAPGATATMVLEAIVASPLENGLAVQTHAQVRSARAEMRSFERTLTVSSHSRFDPSRNVLLSRGSRTIAPGCGVTFALTIVNTGSVGAHDAVLTITHAPGLEEITVIEGGEQRSLVHGTLVLGTLAPQMPRSLVIAARASTPQRDGTELWLGARLAASDGVDIDLGEQRHIIRSRPRYHADTSRFMRISDAPLRYDRVTPVVIELANEGDDTAADVAVELRLPEELELTAVDEPSGEGNAIAFGELTAGASRQATIHLRLRKLLPRGTTVSFGGWVRSRGSAPFSLEPLALPVEAQPACNGATLDCEPSQTLAPGSQLSYTLSLRNTGDGQAARLALRVRPSGATKFLPRSMSINGAPVHDSIALSLFSSLGGLELRDVAPHVDVIVRWFTLVDDPIAAGTLLEAQAEVSLDGMRLPDISSPSVRVGAVAPFLGAALQLPFSVIPVPGPQGTERQNAPPVNGTSSRDNGVGSLRETSIAVRPPWEAFAPRPAFLEGRHERAQHVDLRLTLTAEWLVRALRFSRDVGDSPGFLRHLFAIRLFFPDGPIAASQVVQRALDAQRAVLRANQERLMLRLRQPEVTFETSDLEHSGARSTCTALFSSLREAVSGGQGPAARSNGYLSLSTSVPCETAAMLVERLTEAPLGCASPWVALAHLVGMSVSHSGDSAAAGEYREALLSALTSFEALTPERFHQTLATHADRDLDELLDRFLRSTALARRPTLDTAALRS